jgi:hypothetical protein
MRTKKVLVIVAALVACLAIGSVTVASAKFKKKKFPATISLAVTTTQAPYAPYNQGAGNFSGHVGSGGPKGCRKGRSVSVAGPTSGAGVTNFAGDYSIPTAVAPPSGTYTATVAKRKIIKKKKHKKFICKAASTTVTVP